MLSTAFDGSGGSGGPHPAAVSETVRERLNALARRYEEAADEVSAIAAGIHASDTGEWRGAAAQACRNRLAEHARRLDAVAGDYRETAATIHAGAAGLAAQLGTVERFADLGSFGAAVLGALGEAGGAPALGIRTGAAP